jgi:FkbM family methyltransferase
MPWDNWVKTLGLDTDGTLFVEIENGLRLFDLCLDSRLSAAVAINPNDLMRAENRRLYYRFLSTLKEIEEIFFHSTYDRSYQFKNGDIVVDAGARIGTFAAKASAAVGEEGRIIAIEPEPRNFACLKKNIKANRLHNLIPIPRMLWSERRQLSLYLSANAASHSAYCDAFYGSTGESILVEADSLDNILEGLGIGSADFIKMDIEGSEIEALKGMRKALASHARMAIAAYHPAEDKSAYTVIVPQLDRLGFTVSCAEGIVQARR